MELIEEYILIPFSSIGVNDIIEICLFTFLIYHLIAWIQRTRAWALLRGALMLVLFYLAASLLHLNNLLYLFRYLASYILIGLIVIFQPEIRKALEQLGRQTRLSRIFSFGLDSRRQSTWYSDQVADDVTTAAYALSKTRTGALIVLERNILLNDYVATGIMMNADISPELLEQIFEHNTPLHDGAVIVRENKILSATCYLPMSANMHISKELGTRHRAGLGISEVSDCITVIVSEETGAVTIALGGRLIRNLRQDEFRRILAREQKKGNPDVGVKDRAGEPDTKENAAGTANGEGANEK